MTTASEELARAPQEVLSPALVASCAAVYAAGHAAGLAAAHADGFPTAEGTRRTKDLSPTALFGQGPPSPLSLLQEASTEPNRILFGEGFGHSGSPPAPECFDLFACHDGCGCEDFSSCHAGCSDDEINDFDCGHATCRCASFCILDLTSFALECFMILSTHTDQSSFLAIAAQLPC